MEIILVVIFLFVVLTLLRAKFSKKSYSSKIFYMILLLGFSLITVIGGMRLGYRSFGNTEIMRLNVPIQNDFIIFMAVPVLYAMLISIFFNLKSLKENIIKIVVVFFIIPLIIPLLAVGLFFSILGSVGNVITIIGALLLAIVLLFLIKNTNASKLKLPLEIILEILCVIIIIFSSDLFFQFKYIETDKEVKNIENMLKENMDTVMGNCEWQIDIRKGFARKDFRSKPEEARCFLIRYNEKETIYEDEKTEYFVIFYDEQDQIEAIPYSLLLRKASGYLPNGSYVRFEADTNIEQIENQIKEKNINISKFSLNDFLSLEGLYIAYSENLCSYDEISSIVGHEIKIVSE